MVFDRMRSWWERWNPLYRKTIDPHSDPNKYGPDELRRLAEFHIARKQYINTAWWLEWAAHRIEELQGETSYRDDRV